MVDPVKIKTKVFTRALTRVALLALGLGIVLAVSPIPDLSGPKIVDYTICSDSYKYCFSEYHINNIKTTDILEIMVEAVDENGVQTIFFENLSSVSVTCNALRLNHVEEKRGYPANGRILCEWTNIKLPVGKQVLTAVAIDGKGNKKESMKITFNVTSDNKLDLPKPILSAEPAVVECNPTCRTTFASTEVPYSDEASLYFEMVK
ncbi:MAG: hypothetical protein COU81_02845 [Candidatus Portnoybacteria bacterium CG10_big_fil_rev_8_21_14_0_10_36_7]|uniref:Uncharacterized protein n=1 Tax=Candidatus Portnoybacteria bacterium CG10_big_fil_rev_8_21_14_0_10_36_7 TaxID=1974812 RepID=A0A2M8KDR4_9BACT|nr:MAG: hypothetical protein COU81_02845 [Candidatus Portnoybacteria bacterium CG10_big_fil_rev_8_21_14_0_10_36_7]